MAIYRVDLHTCPESEHDRIYQILSGFAVPPSPLWTGNAGVYLVDWDCPETIESVTGLPSSLVSLHQG